MGLVKQKSKVDLLAWKMAIALKNFPKPASKRQDILKDPNQSIEEDPKKMVDKRP